MMAVSRALSLALVLALVVVACAAIRSHQRPEPTSRQPTSLEAQSSLGTPPPPAPTPDYISLPPFPAQFTAKYFKYDANYGTITNSSGVIYQDQRNQRCRMTSRTGLATPYYNIEQLAIFRPPYAQPNSAPANLLTLFNYGPYGVPSKYPALFSARTSETWFQSTYPFPEHWFLSSGGQPNVQSFWQVPYYMWYNGTTTVNGVSGIRYISLDTCNIARIGVIPCTTYIINPQTGVPIQTINAHQRRPNSYESDRYTVMTFSDFQIGAPDPSVFELPSNWVQLYRNYNNDVQVERQGGSSYSIVTPGQPLLMYLYLRTVPQQGLGVVTVNVFNSPDKTYNCTNCITWSPSSFNFDTSNWHTPQLLTVTYIKDGNQKLDLSTSGGGYDYVRESSDKSYYLSFVTCTGETGVYCDKWRNQ